MKVIKKENKKRRNKKENKGYEIKEAIGFDFCKNRSGS